MKTKTKIFFTHIFFALKTVSIILYQYFYESLNFNYFRHPPVLVPLINQNDFNDFAEFAFDLVFVFIMTIIVYRKLKDFIDNAESESQPGFFVYTNTSSSDYTDTDFFFSPVWALGIYSMTEMFDLYL